MIRNLLLCYLVIALTVGACAALVWAQVYWPLAMTGFIGGCLLMLVIERCPR